MLSPLAERGRDVAACRRDAVAASTCTSFVEADGCRGGKAEIEAISPASITLCSSREIARGVTRRCGTGALRALFMPEPLACASRAHRSLGGRPWRKWRNGAYVATRRGASGI